MHIYDLIIFFFILSEFLILFDHIEITFLKKKQAKYKHVGFFKNPIERSAAVSYTV